MKTVFLGVTEPESSGVMGLFESVLRTLNKLNLPKDKLVGICTDGESANTGKQRGLWRLLQDSLGREILCVWCTCHRTDLAMESIESSVPELKLWKSNLRGIATFFHVSKARSKLLLKIADEDGGIPLKFPSFFEVRLV